MRGRLPTARLVVCAAAALLVSTTVMAETVVVVGARSGIKQLSKEQVFNIFLGRQGSLPESGEVVPIDLAANDPIRLDFYQRYLGKTPSQANAYWAKMIFSGKGQPPHALANAAAMRRTLADHPEYLGYLDRSELDANLRIVATP